MYILLVLRLIKVYVGGVVQLPAINSTVLPLSYIPTSRHTKDKQESLSASAADYRRHVIIKCPT